MIHEDKCMDWRGIEQGYVQITRKCRKCKKKLTLGYRITWSTKAIYCPQCLIPILKNKIIYLEQDIKFLESLP